MSAGQIFTGSGVDSVIITGSLVGAATVRLDNSGSSEEAADSITIGNISSGVVYGESGADSFNISGDARSATIYGGAQNDSVTIGGSLISALSKVVKELTTSSWQMSSSSTIKGGPALTWLAHLVLFLLALFMETAATIPSLSLVQSQAQAYGGAGDDSVT